MKKQRFCSAVFLTIILIFTRNAIAGENGRDNRNFIQTTGMAEIFSQNDSASISISVISEGKRLETVGSDNAKKTDAVLSAIKKMNIKNLSLQTGNYRVSPRWDYKSSPHKIVGYEVQNTIDVKMEKVEAKNLSESSSGVIGTALESGANSIAGVRFYVKDRDALENEALGLATRKAREQAESIAIAAGVKIKKIMRISTQPDTMPFTPKMMRSADMAGVAESAAPPMEIGESGIAAQVNMIVEIE